jgi:hypothetical protein
MTDKEKVISLLTELGIGFEDESNIIHCHEGMSKVEGYIRFYMNWTFDENGKFINIGIWE